MSLLGVEEFPFTSDQLKRGYRQSLLKYHPDHNRGTEAKSKTIDIIKAYKEIRNLAIDLSDADEEKAKSDISKAESDLFDLTEECSLCRGLGYKISTHHEGECI